VLLVGAAGDETAAAAVGDEDREVLLRHARELSPELILQAIDALGAADGDMRWAVRSSLPVEMAVIRLTQGAGAPALTAHPPATASSRGSAATAHAEDTAALIQRIQRLEALVARLAEGAMPTEREASAASAPPTISAPVGSVAAPESGERAPSADGAAKSRPRTSRIE